MTPFRIRLTARCAATAIAALVLLGATGCTATAGPSDAEPSEGSAVTTEMPTPVPTAHESTSGEDEATCAAYGDVQTILLNAQVAYQDDRMGEQEKRGWFALASRVLGIIPSADEGRVSDAVTAVKAAVPAVPDLNATNIGSRDWAALDAELIEACDAAGFQIVTNSFTGG